ncbi:MAG TPA: hypothetical protein VFT72_11380 [Opitutaceae bacterium]|nr:hypothetical protein [Opitutaceae bacterium]
MAVSLRFRWTQRRHVFYRSPTRARLRVDQFNQGAHNAPFGGSDTLRGAGTLVRRFGESAAKI